MTIREALNRVKWRVSGNGWKRNDNDTEALNMIISCVNMNLESQLSKNELEAKLYIMVFAQYIKERNTTVFDSISQKEFHKHIARPIENILDDFTRQLNSSGQYEILNTSGILNDHTIIQSRDKEEQEAIILCNIIKNPKEKAMLFGEIWNIESVKKNIMSQYNKFKSIYHV